MATKKRLIDADALIDGMKKRCNSLIKEYGSLDHYADGYAEAINYVENAPIDKDNNVPSNTEDIYPLVIICDRYTGTYSGGKYTAWNHDLEDIPPEIDGDDVDCRNFWWGGEADKYNVGKGSTIAEAVMDLARKLPKGE